MSAIEYLSENCYPIGIEDAINSIKGAEILVSPLLSYKPTLITPRSTIDNLLPYISCDSKVKETMHFTYRVLIINTEFSDTIKRYYIISETNSNRRSNYSIN